MKLSHVELHGHQNSMHLISLCTCIIEGASDMEAGSEPRAGAVLVVEALNAYGEHFEHPGWQPLD